jgi:glycosyltransferase involved in cell wall biosynthesis
MKKILVTLLLPTYNQEDFVSAAVYGAISQDYTPLEIIISDDFSSDKTFDVIKKIVSLYEGQHIIKINQNKYNMGIAAHVRYLQKIATGKIIVNCAGDDISFSNRVSKIMEEYYNSHSPPSMIVSNAMKINRYGDKCGLLVNDLNERIFDLPVNPMLGLTPMLGCTAAYDKDLAENFPPTIRGIIAEDVVLKRRSYLSNGILYIPDVLKYYRINSNGIGDQGVRNRSKFLLVNIANTEEQIIGFEQMRLDLNHINLNNKNIYSEINKQEKIFELKLKLLKDNFLRSTYSFIVMVLMINKNIINNKEIIRIFIIRWLPFLINFKN